MLFKIDEWNVTNKVKQLYKYFKLNLWFTVIENYLYNLI